MPTEKPLPDDDIIDLTDLVEEGSAGGAPSNDPSPADISFEQELDDLFADAEPASPAAGSAEAPATAPADDDVIDLEGLELSEETSAEADVTDLPGLDSEAASDQETTPASAPSAEQSADDEPLDLSDLSFDDLGLDEPEPAQATAETNLDALSPAEPAAATDAELDASAVDALLGDLPDATTTEATTTPQPAEPTVEAIPDQAAPAGETAPTAGTAAQPIDLDALDQIITSAKEPEAEPATIQTEGLTALTARLDALEAATASLTSQIELLSRTADADMLAASLSERLEGALIGRLESLRDELSPPTVPVPPDAAALEALRSELLGAIDNARPDNAGLIDELRLTLDNFHQALHTDISTTLNARFDDILDAAKQVARDEARSIRDELIARLDSLETEHLDPEALAEKVRQSVLPTLSDDGTAMETAKQALAGLAERVTTGDFQTAMQSLRADIADEILHSVPKAAAAVIREEIAALVKDFG